jgi:hypothetical protein
MLFIDHIEHIEQFVPHYLSHLVARELLDSEEPFRALVGAEVLTSVNR